MNLFGSRGNCGSLSFAHENLTPYTCPSMNLRGLPGSPAVMQKDARPSLPVLTLEGKVSAARGLLLSDESWLVSYFKVIVCLAAGAPNCVAINSTPTTSPGFIR